MDNLKSIQENYKKMDIDKLIQLSMQPHDLRLEVVPILQEELLSRGLKEEAMALTEFLIGTKEETRFQDMSTAELKQLITDRLESGEPIESIKLDLKDDGINIFDVINDDTKLKDEAFDYIVDLKQKGIEDSEIDKKLKENLSIDKEDSEMLKIQLKQNGKQNLTLGYAISIIALLLMTMSLSLGGNVTIGGGLLLAIGIWRIFRGYEQTKD